MPEVYPASSMRDALRAQGSTKYAAECPAPNTLTMQAQRMCATSRRIKDNLNELSARLVLPSENTPRGQVEPPDPSHAQACFETAEANLASIEETLASLLTRV